MITLRAEPITDAIRAEVAAALDGTPTIRAKTDTSAGMVDAAECIGGGTFFRVLDDGVPVAFYVLRLRVRGARRDAEIVVAHGRADFDLVEHVVPLIKRQCAMVGCEAVRVQTRRAGLVRKLENMGFSRASVVLRMELK
ncbi:hypothetical protein WT29_23345 [Burkholderia stagnalis]|uniref:N-acetyltransferase domain-containing protein n=1 Tax=Burkholderia stagnalis TaxID=1503054 RepID=A0A6L3MVU3_9BURK|nr:hypothetical protein [Burkholderia stagnalis]KAB0637265.1 hypothetical protein F7R25_15995 [Burkholderia stagnalis]KVW61786.1 hypothetical protein WT28_15785 [Burkholderia stagnalis]KVW75026.1 hypothetical protein WT29_23345 [Burkholderia stagnalis]KVX78582.1 hypothetical protein WT34_10575 [Burkholderia stagnalis]KWN53948.1 hypothetical protein WT89_23640 [Burkholderia stagnalis]